MSNDGLIIENMDLSHIHLAVLSYEVVSFTFPYKFSCFQVVDGSKTKGCKAQSGFGKLCALSLDDFNAKAGAACPGDSGSPLVTYHEQNGGWTLIGLLSNGAKSCFKGLPEVYTKVGDYLDWIHTTINENSLHNIQVYP